MLEADAMTSPLLRCRSARLLLPVRLPLPERGEAWGERLAVLPGRVLLPGARLPEGQDQGEIRHTGRETTIISLLVMGPPNARAGVNEKEK